MDRRAGSAGDGVTGYLIGLDLGTSALKGVLASPDRGIVAIAERGYEMYRSHEGWAENDPEDWVRAAAQAVPELLARGDISAGDVAAVCIVGQRDIGALIDADGAPLGRCIHWSDRRHPDETEQLFDRLGRERLLDSCGTAPIPGLLLANLVWTSRHEPELFARARAVMAPKDYLAYRLTGEVATDRTTPTRSLLNDWRTDDWCRTLCDEARIPYAILPPVRFDAWDVRAVLDDRAALIGLKGGTVLAAGGGDDPSAALSCGVTEPGQLSIGSSSSMSWRVVAKRPSVTAGSPLGVLPHVVPGRYLHEMVVTGTGTSLRWFRQAVAAAGGVVPSYEDLLAEAAAVAPGAGGVLFYPYVEGATVPYDDDRVRGAFVGIAAHHGRGHLARAIVEGIAFQYPALLDIVEELGHDVGAITISDGEARSRTWNQVKADVMNRPLRVAAVPEAPAVGAAILAGMAAGNFATADAGVAALTRPPETIVPDPVAHRTYEEHRRRWEAARPHVFALADALAAGAPEALSRG
jgi:sugar (pentulose or hexulose) kinase